MTTGKVYRVLISVGTLILAAALLCACGSSPEQQQEGVPLSQAIGEAAARVEKSLPAGTKLALLNFNAPSETFSRYVLDELTAIFVTNGNLVIVDRKDIDLLRGETQFQLSGEVNDESAQSIGQMLGAQSILSGSLTELGGVFRFMVKALNVETARVEVLFPQDLRPDDRVAALLGTAPAQTTSPQIPAGSARQTSAAPQTTAASPARQPVAAAQLENYPPELDRRLAELAAMPAATETAALIEQRNAWVTLLQYIETYYRDHPEFAVIYDPAVVQENINYERGTVTAKVAVSLTPLSGYRKAITSVKTALDKTGKSGEWGWGNWPAMSRYFVNDSDIFFEVRGRHMIDRVNSAKQYARDNFLTGTIYTNSALGGPQFYGKRMSARAALLKGDGEVIAVNDQTLEYVTGYSNPGERVPFTFAPAAISVWFSFFGIKASDVSGDVTFKIISINNVSLDTKDSDYVRITPETINKE